ncbi:MAG: VanZ family protein [Flavobacteriia bacterium]|nr:VanZ family protein [Flavobacteriia bacterium]
MWIPSSDTGVDLDWFFLGIRSDHWIHAILFSPFMFFCFQIFEKKHFLIHFFLGISLACFLESSHYFIPYRSFSIFDFFANLCGIIVGSTFYLKKRIE